MDKIGTIYIFTNIIYQKQYVGQTVRSLKERINSHKSQNSILHRAIKKYGIENFKAISFSCPEKDLDWTETFLIKELNTLAPNGYNLDSGGNKNKHHHETTKNKISKSLLGKNVGENNGMFGKPGPMLGRKGKNNPLFGIKRPEISKQMRGKNNPFYGDHRFAGINNPMYGKRGIDSPNYGRLRPGTGLSGKNNPAAKAVILISPEGKEYDLSCYVPFCKEHNLTPSHITQVLQGKRKHHKGWTGRYLKNNK